MVKKEIDQIGCRTMSAPYSPRRDSLYGPEDGGPKLPVPVRVPQCNSLDVGTTLGTTHSILSLCG